MKIKADINGLTVSNDSNLLRASIINNYNDHHKKQVVGN